MTPGSTTRSRTRILAIVAIASIAAIAGIAAGAFGYWTGAGSGTGTTTLQTSQALALSPGTPSTQISPGRIGGVATVASNPNPYPVKISAISLDAGQGSSGFGVDAGHSGCVPMFDFTVQTNGGDGWTVPAKAGSTPGELLIEMPAALSMGTGASNACQGAAFTVHLVGVV
jgi:hypothetical protein